MTVLNAHHRQADAVMGNTLVYLQLVNKRAGQRQVYILTVALDSGHRSKLFDYSGKHNA